MWNTTNNGEIELNSGNEKCKRRLIFAKNSVSTSYISNQQTELPFTSLTVITSEEVKGFAFEGFTRTISGSVETTSSCIVSLGATPRSLKTSSAFNALPE